MSTARQDESAIQPDIQSVTVVNVLNSTCPGADLSVYLVHTGAQPEHTDGDFFFLLSFFCPYIIYIVHVV